MSIFTRIFNFKSAEKREVSSLNLIQLMTGASGGAKFVAVTNKKAVNLGVVFECLDVITRTMSLVSPKVYKVTNNGKEIDYKNPLYITLNSNPYRLYSAREFYKRIIIHYLLFGNAFIEIIKNGKETQLKIHEPDNIDVEIVDVNGVEDHYYKINKSSNGNNDVGRVIAPEKMIHIMDYNIDGVKGISRIQSKANTLKNAGQIQNYATEMYQNGANISGYIYGDRTVTKEALDYLRQKFEETYTSKNGGVAALPLGFKYEPLQYNIPFADAQIIEGSKFAVEDVARIFGVPLTLIGRGESADNKGETDFNKFLTVTIAPLFMMIESEFNRRLFMDSTSYMKFELKGLYRVDMKARYESYRIALNAGFMNDDEVRALEEMPPLPNGLGQKYMKPLNMIPTEMIEDYFNNVINSAKEVNNDNTGI